MTPVFEESLVSIVRAEGVNIAFPSTMSRFELASVLHGLSGALFASEVDVAREARAVPAQKVERFRGVDLDPEVQITQGANRRSTDDRRKWPRKKVTKQLQGGKVELLECGHKLAVPSNWKKHKSRACAECAS